jgi:peptidoglycan/LPS O-acetylase OafA/YrhL
MVVAKVEIPEIKGHGRAMLGRVVQLDSLRGVAAMTVVWHHWWSASATGKPRWYLFPLVAGHEAVILFFVLSGYVLSIPVWTKRQPGYGVYLIRRVSRIYLPYLAAAVLAGVGCYFFFGSKLPLGHWFYQTWQTPLSAGLIVQQVLMDPKPVLNTAFWSLRYEMEMSIIFPFLCLLMLRMGRYSGIALVVAVRVAEYLYVHSRFGENDFDKTLYYAMFFIAGAALSRERESLKRLAGRAGTALLWATLAVALLAYWNAALVHMTERASDAVSMVGICVLIILIQDPRMHVGLKTAVADYLGRISYSLYLVHGTVLFTLLNLLWGKVPLVALALLYGACTMVLAHVFCVLVEEPSLRAGKRVALASEKQAE